MCVYICGIIYSPKLPWRASYHPLTPCFLVNLYVSHKKIHGFFLQHSNLAGGFKCSILHPTLKEDLQFTHMFAMSIVSQPTESNLLKGQGSQSLTFVETENKVHCG